MADATASTSKPKKTPAKQAELAAASGSANTSEAKSRFNAALEEAKAGAVALKSEAGERAAAYREQAKGKRDSYVADAKGYGDQAKVKAGELAVEGKKKTSDAISGLANLISETAPKIDQQLGEKYGDYARSASRSLQEGAAKLDTKSIDELGEDAREFVRKSPGTAIGIAAVTGFLLARLFRGRSD